MTHPTLRPHITLRLRAALAALLLLLAAVPAGAQQTGVVDGLVVTSDGTPAAGAEVRIVDLGRFVMTDGAGAFRFDGVPSGSFLIQASSDRWGRAVERVDIRPGEPISIDLVLEPLRELDEIVVSASPRALRGFEAAQPLSVLSGTDLSARARSSLGETLASEPGVSSSYFGPGASRPIIRGLGGDRVRILEGGIGVGDASSTSPDHAVSIEPRAAQRIEIVRGPATLLYGSSAIGGVVNVIDRRIPSERPAGVVSGYVEGLGGTVADERTGSVDLTIGAGPIAVSIGGLERRTDDYAIPGRAEADGDEGHGHEDDEHEAGILENSFVETTRGAIGASLVGPSGYFGLAVGSMESRYGVPGHGHHDEGSEGGGEEEEAPVSIRLDNTRWDLEGAWRNEGATLRTIKARFGATDYEHVELEGAEVGTTFLNDSWEARVELDHQLGEDIGGAVGAQISSRDFEAIGEEAFVPPNATDRVGIFVFEELAMGPTRVQFGLRYEHQNTASEALDIDRDFQALSGSLGLNWSAGERVTIGLALARSVKFPNAEELFSNGPHLATNSFELGNPDLDPESAWSADATLRLRQGRATGALTAFANRFDRFIYQRATGEMRDELPLYVFDQEDALFVGYEAEVEVELLHRGDHHVALQLMSDYVRATLTETDVSPPRIPPLQVGLGLAYDVGGVHAHLGIRRTTRQGRVGEGESETPGYTLIDASAMYRLVTGRLIHEIVVGAENLGDVDARSHTSFLKDVAPFPGRALQVSYRVSF